MQYFTLEWVWHLPDAEEDKVRDAYWRHVEGLSLSAEARRLVDTNLHDAHVLAVEHKESLKLRLRCGDLQRGYSDLAVEYIAPRISSNDLKVLEAVAGLPEIEVLYDEVDVDVDLVHRILLSSEQEVEIRCQDVNVSEEPVVGREAV